jgi:hypothetical protein
MASIQLQTLNQDLEAIMGNLRDIEKQVRASYGGDTPPTRRAGEALGAVQRLIWALERHPQGTAAGNAQ